MNLPNRLILLRILLVPLCLILAGMGYYLWAAALFLIAGLTDILDGYLARKKQLITDFGKFADPIADKILVLSMSIMLAYKGFLPVWLPIILVFRELAVDGLRLIAVQRGKMILIIYVLVFEGGVLMLPASILVAILTIYSGAEYFWKLRGLFKKDLGL